MKTWSIYDTATGRFTGETLRGPQHVVDLNLREGCAAIEGTHDHLSARVELSTGFVVDYQPEAPDSDHVWNAQNRRWELVPAIVERDLRRRDALQTIQVLEAKQPRAIRELALGLTGAKERLEAIDRAISDQRSRLKEA